MEGGVSMSDKKDLSPLDAAIRWRKEHPGWMGLDTSRHGNDRTWPKLKNKPIQVNLDEDADFSERLRRAAFIS